MSLRVSVYVRQECETYESHIKFLSQPPLELNCKLIPKRHDVTVTSYDGLLNPDAETCDLLEHLTLLGARQIRTEMVDLRNGCRICEDTDEEFGILYTQHQIPGQVETELRMKLPPSLQSLIATRRDKLPKHL